MKKKILISISALTLGLGGAIVGCGGGSSSAGLPSDIIPDTDPEVVGTGLYCVAPESTTSSVANELNASQPLRKNVSNDINNGNAQNRMKRLSTVITPVSSDGNETETKEAQVHPILISYAEQVVGDYELGDGSADVGDPTHLDDIFVSMSRDDGQTWKKYYVGKTADKSSIQVQWAGETIDYYGHSVKADMAVQGNNILVAWQDKYCPSGNPFDLNASDDANTTYPDDFFQVNGAQGSIDYTDSDGTVMIALPNGKEVYEVPFSCVWTARGIFNEETLEIDWMKEQQLTSGRRDAAKIWIAPSEAGFAITWQEDPEGLRSGKGAGPGAGWSGATTNHGADIWYTHITMDNFVLTEDQLEDNETKLKPLVNFAYPVRITDNEGCNANDTKLYCQELCAKFGTQSVTNTQGEDILRCKTGDTDMLTDTQVVMDGDTGASRPAMQIFKSDASDENGSEYVVVLGYEETKGLAETEPGVPDQDQGDDDTNISVEGKSVYYESFPFDNPVMVSAGNIVNQMVPDQNTSEMIYENARRLVIVSQIDPCDEGDYVVGFLYKQGFETQGGSSDMFLRMNTSFAYETFLDAVNVSAQDSVVDENGTVIGSTWTEANLDDYSYENGDENTFSPRGFMRGNDIYIGFEYTPNYAKTEQGNMPNNFYIHRYTDGAWQGPQNISMVAGHKVSTLDPRFLTTPKGAYDKTGLESDKSNPNVLFLAYGTFDMESGEELDLYYTRSTDKGVTWETVVNEVNATVNATLAGVHEVEEKEVQTMATPDGTRLFNAWLQEDEEGDNPAVADHWEGLDTWFGLVDYNVTN